MHEELSNNDVEAELHNEKDQGHARRRRRDSCEQDLIMASDKRYMLSCRLPHPPASQEAKATVDEWNSTQC